MSDRQEKKAQFAQNKKRGFLPWIVIVLVVVAAAATLGWNAVGGNDGKYPLVKGTNGKITIPESRVSDGKAHYFSYENGEDPIDFFILKSHDGVIRAAFDTCDVCYKEKKGYRQEGDFMVCNNCDQKFRSDMINQVKGGCNPAPLNRLITNGQLVIAEADLVQGAKYFQVAGE